MATAADLLKCSLCLSEFKDPRALPCLHTFCLKCLINLADANQEADTLKCPMCQEHHKMPQNGAGGFRKDFRINSFIEMYRTEEFLVRVTVCKRHPKLELTHLCEERSCNRAVLCAQCVAQSHGNHAVTPIRSICEARLSDIGTMRKAIKDNYKVLNAARSSLHSHQSQAQDKVRERIQEYRVMLDQLEKTIQDDLNRQVLQEEKDSLNFYEGILQVLEEQLKELGMKCSGTIPNIVRVNADGNLDADFHRIHEVLNKLSFKLGMPKVNRDAIIFCPLHASTNWSEISVVEMKELDVKLGPVVLSRPTVPPIKAKETVTWQRLDNDIRGIACHSNGGGDVSILSSSHLRVYKQNNGEMFHSSDNEQGDRVATFQDRCHAILDRRLKGVRLYRDWPIFLGRVNHILSTHEDVGYGISGTENYLVYSTQRNFKSSKLHCYSVAQNRPKCVWRRQLASHDTPRSLSAMETPKQLLVVVANSFPDGIPTKKASAIAAVNGPGKYLWKISFETLDSEAKKFQLRDMCNDGSYFYVLNAEECCVYLISVEGKVLSKILQNLERPRALACSSERKELIVACSGGAVKFYKLIYPDQS